MNVRSEESMPLSNGITALPGATPEHSRRERLISWRYRADAGAALGLSPLQLRYVAIVNEKIAKGDYPTESSQCPCGEQAGDVIARVDRYGIVMSTVQCKACGTLRFDPYLSPESVSDFYTAYYQDMYARAPDPRPYFERQKKYGQRLLDFLAASDHPVKVIAEVGCGAGGALSAFQDAGYTVHGCDYSARLIEHGRQNGLPQLCQGDIEPLIAQMNEAGTRADVVLLHHVFEHLSDPLAWLQRAKALLQPDGVVVIAVPDCADIARYPSPDGDLRLFLHIAHKYNFTLGGLQALAGRAGMRADPIAVRKSDQAPEMWVAFSHAGRGSGFRTADDVWQGRSEALFRRLRYFEMAYVWRAAWRKLGRSLRRKRPA
jgi:SAM-dependent methyltransferase